MTSLVAGISVAGAIYLLAVLRLYAGQSRRIYRPHPEIVTTPDAHGFRYEDITFTTEDGVTLNGWFVPREGARYVLFFFHGNTRNISDCIESIAIFHRLGFSTFLFDYRGYGRSRGKPSERGTGLDAEAAWRYLVSERRIPPDRIVMLGRSLGAAIAARLATQHPPRALVIESTFTSLPDIAAELHPWLPARRLARYQYSVRECLRRIRCPILVVHSRDDELIPWRHGRILFDSANAPKSFLEISGSHYGGFLDSGVRYTAGLEQFFTRHLGNLKDEKADSA